MDRMDRIELWFFRAGHRLELWETANVLQRVDHSRGLLSIAEGPFAAKKLAMSVVQISRQTEDSITVHFSPHPLICEMDPNFYCPLTVQQKMQARAVLERERRQQESARQNGI